MSAVPHLFTPTPATPDLWHYLADATRAGRPVVLYGMGNGADKIIAVCDCYGIPVSDVFASDGFVRGHSFRGKTVLSFTDVCKKYSTDRLIVLLSFASSRPDVLEAIARVAAVAETYAPDVPVCGTELYNAAFTEAHRVAIEAARALFSDDESRRVYDGILQYKLSGRLDTLRATESEPGEAMRTILHADRFRTVADLGAYNGDSIRALRAYAPSLSTVIAMEPDRRNFRKLDKYASTLAESGDALRVLPVQAGAWSHDQTLRFHGSGNRNAGLTDAPATEATIQPLPQTADNPYFGKNESVAVRTLDGVADELLAGQRLDFIKYDVEGAEREALLGSRRLIERDAPSLLVSVYHRSEDLFALPLLVHKLNPAYRLTLRRMAGVPAWDINLYACPS